MGNNQLSYDCASAVEFLHCRCPNPITIDFAKWRLVLGVSDWPTYIAVDLWVGKGKPCHVVLLEPDSHGIIINVRHAPEGSDWMNLVVASGEGVIEQLRDCTDYVKELRNG